MEMAATSRTTLKPQNLPPTERAAYYHSLRVHLQVVQWKSLMGSSLSPIEWGWRLIKGCFEPIMTDLEAAPENILKFVRCNCKVSTKNPCETNICTCRKNGLQCVAACGNCHGQECNNSETNNSEEDLDTYLNDANIFELLEDF